MAAVATRVFVQAGGDYYLMPLPMRGKVPQLLEELLAQVWAKEQSLQPIPAPESEATEGQRDLLALGFETTRWQEVEIDRQEVIWEERLLVVYSPTLARQARRGLEARLKRTEQELAALTPPRGRGRRQWEHLEALQAAVQRILKQRRVEGLLEVTPTREVERRSIRKYGDRPARMEERWLPERTIRHDTPLSALQRRILELLDLPVSIYEDLALPVDPNPP